MTNSYFYKNEIDKSKSISLNICPFLAVFGIYFDLSSSFFSDALIPNLCLAITFALSAPSSLR